jgi:hypothetical protein
MSLLEELEARGVTAEDLEKAASVRLFEKAAAAEGVNLDDLEENQVEELYAHFVSNNLSDADNTKEASAMNDEIVDLFEKTAAAEGIDLDEMADDELAELYNHYVENVLPEQIEAFEGEKQASDEEIVFDMFQKTASAEDIDLNALNQYELTDLYDHYVENVLPLQIGDEEAIQKVADAQEKLAEAELLGRHMARAYVDEIEKEAAAPSASELNERLNPRALVRRAKGAMERVPGKKGKGMSNLAKGGLAAGGLALAGGGAYALKKRHDKKKAEKNASFDGEEIAALLMISDEFGADVAYDTAEKIAAKKDRMESAGQRDTDMATERAQRMSDRGLGQYLHSGDVMKKNLKGYGKGYGMGAAAGGALGAGIGALTSNKKVRKAGAAGGALLGALGGGALGGGVGVTLAKDKDLREKGIYRPLRGFLGSAAGSEMTPEARKKYLGEKRSSADDVVELAAHMLDVAGYEID